MDLEVSEHHDVRGQTGDKRLQAIVRHELIVTVGLRSNNMEDRTNETD